MGRCNYRTLSGRKCVRTTEGGSCYQHLSKKEKEELEDLEIFAYGFPSSIGRKAFLKIYSTLSQNKRKYFLRLLDLDTQTTLEDLDEMFYKKEIPIDAYLSSSFSNEVVLPKRTQIKILFDYPNEGDTRSYDSKNPQGFTKRELLDIIRQEYQEDLYLETIELFDDTLNLIFE